MSLIKDMQALSPQEQLKKLNSLAQDCRTTQQSVLLDIVSKNKDTQIGKKYRFDKINSIEEFQKALPIADWDDIYADAKKMEDGANDILFSGRAETFIMSSGTSGKPKHIPESSLGSQAKSLVSNLRTSILAGQIDIKDKNTYVFPFSNSSTVGVTSANIPLGSASGLTLAKTDKALHEKLAYPSEILSFKDQSVIDYLMARFALEKNVKALVGNNPARMVSFFETVIHNQEDLIADIEKGTLASKLLLDDTLEAQLNAKISSPNPSLAAKLRSFIKSRGKLIPSDYWPDLDLVSFWLSGSVGSHAPKLKRWVTENVKYFDCGYGASEGKFNIPLKPFDPAGLLATPSYFFEFKTMDGAKILLADELEDRTSYQLIITSYSGLYRYDMHDVIRVDGFIGNTPQIFFESKTKDFLNISGEKIPGKNVTDLVQSFLREHSISARHVAVCANQKESFYQIVLELDPKSQQKLDKNLVHTLDELLQEKEYAYQILRSQNALAPLELHVMDQNWLEALIDYHTPQNGGKNQIKLPVVYHQIPLVDMRSCIVKNS